MPQVTTINEPILLNQAHLEKWILVRAPNGRRYLLLEAAIDGDAHMIDDLHLGKDCKNLVGLSQAEQAQMPDVMRILRGDTALAMASLKARSANLDGRLFNVQCAFKTQRDSLPQITAWKEARAKFSKLTQREHEVLDQVLAGHPNKMIAHNLGLNQRTVETHRAALMKKTGSKCLPTLVRLALTAGIHTA